MTNATATNNLKQQLRDAIENGEAVSVCHSMIPAIGGWSAAFYRTSDGDGFCRVHGVDENNFGTVTVTRVSESVIDAADAVKFDPCDTAGIALAYLRIAGVRA